MTSDPFLQFEPVTQVVSSKPVKVPTQEEKPVRTTRSQRSLIPDLELDVGGSEIRSQRNEGMVSSLMLKHSSILVSSRPGTKVWDRIFLVLRQLLDGTVLEVNPVDHRWLTRVSHRAPIVVPHYADFDELISNLDSVLTYLEEVIPSGFWYPRILRNGQRERVTLADFILPLTRTGEGWSPYLELVGTDLVTPRMLRESFPEAISDRLKSILEESWFYRSMTRTQEVDYWQHAKMLSSWFYANRDSLQSGCPENQLVFSSFPRFLDVVRDANKEIGCVSQCFLGPWSTKWAPFLRWLIDKRNCKIPKVA